MKTKSHFPNFAAKVKAAGIDPNDCTSVLDFIRANIRESSFVDFGLLIVSAPDEETFERIITTFAHGRLPELPKNQVGEIFFRIFDELDSDCA